MDLEGKKLKVIFDDGAGVSFKVGTVKSCADNFLIFTSGEAIAIAKIIRIEPIGDYHG